MTTTREDIKAALQRALSGATFDVGRIVTEHPEARLTSYDGHPDETLDAQGVRQMYECARQRNEPLSGVSTPMVRITAVPQKYE